MKKSVGRRRWIAVFAVVVAALCLTTAASSAPSDELTAFADQRASRSAAERWTDPAASALDALGAYRLHPDQSTATALYGAMQAYRYLVRVLPTHAGRVTALVSDAVDQLLFTFGRDGMLRSVDVTSGQPVDARAVGAVTAARYDPVGHAIVVGDASGAVRSYPVDRTGKIGVPHVRATLSASVAGIGLSDGPVAVAVGTDGRAAVFDVTADTAAIGVDAGQVDEVRAVSDILTGSYHDQILLATATRGILALRLPAAGTARTTVAVAPDLLPGNIRQMAVSGSDSPALVLSTTQGVYWATLSGYHTFSRDDITPVTMTSDLGSGTGSVYDRTGAPLLSITSGGDAVAAAGGTGLAVRSLDYVDRPGGPGADAPYSGAIDAITLLAGPDPYSDRHMMVATATGLLLELNLDAAHDTLASPPPSTVLSYLDARTTVLADLDADTNTARALYTTDLTIAPVRDKDQATILSRPNIMRYELPSTIGVAVPFFVVAVDASDTLLVGGGAHHGGGGCVFVWDRRTGKLEQTLEIPQAAGKIATDVFVDADLGLIVAHTSGNHVLAWSTASWRPVMDIALDGPGDLRSDPVDGSRLIATVTLASGEINDVTIDLKAHSVTARRPSPDGIMGRMRAGSGSSATFVAVAADGTLYRQDAAGHTVGPPIVSTHGEVSSVAVHPQGARVAIAYGDGTVAIVNLLGPPITYTVRYNISRARPLGVRWSTDGRYLAVSTGRSASSGFVAARTDLLSADPRLWVAALCGIAAPAIRAHHWDRQAPGSAPSESVLCPRSEKS